MITKGSPAWYRRHDPQPATPEQIRATARANGMFHAPSERAAFEDWFRGSRSGRGATYVDRLFERLPDGTYARPEAQRHWHTWTMAVGAGRMLPRYDPIKLAADRIAAEVQQREGSQA